MKKAKDNFSAHADSYSRFRPLYPEELFSFIYSHLQNFDCALDCGTGNGQVAGELSEKFKNVFATDISDKQLRNAVEKKNINYCVSRAEKTNLPDKHFDLITVGQALHWFDLKEFYKEVTRVAKPDALIAVWGYGLLNISEEIDSVILNFYENVIGKYWDEERRLVETGYRTIEFPFDEIDCPYFNIEVNWGFPQLINYLNTWSAVQKFIHQNNHNPVELLEPKIKGLWGKAEVRKIYFPIFMRMGRIKNQ